MGFETSTICALIYNGMAFAFQLPIGTLGDKFHAERSLSILGCLLVGIGAMIDSVTYMCLIIGVGNACFHIGGGIEVLKKGGIYAAPVGMFVSPGAIGIFLGPKIAGSMWFSKYIPVMCMAVCALLLYLIKPKDRNSEVKIPQKSRIECKYLGGIVVCMFVTVVIRSYMGTVLCYESLSNMAFASAYTLGIFFGKHFGGVFADRINPVRSCLLTQIPATILLMLSIEYPLLAIPGIFLFNTTMPVTAHALYMCIPPYPGTMFGVTTYALFLGGAPRLLGMENMMFTAPGLCILGMVSTLFLIVGLQMLEGGTKDRLYSL